MGSQNGPIQERELHVPALVSLEPGRHPHAFPGSTDHGVTSFLLLACLSHGGISTMALFIPLLQLASHLSAL